MPDCQPLPFLPELFPDELLSSWLQRTAAEYGVSLSHLARHIGLSKATPVKIDEELSPDEIERLAKVIRTTSADLRQRMHQKLRLSVRPLRVSQWPIQICPICRNLHRETSTQPVFLKAWFEFWQIECAACRIPLSSPGPPNLAVCNPAREWPAWYAGILPAARAGSSTLSRFAGRRPAHASLSPVAVLCLLSKHLPNGWNIFELDSDYVRHRVVEMFVPGLLKLSQEDVLVAAPWTKQKPARLVTSRTILLAGMSHFLADPAASFRRVLEAVGPRGRSFAQRWLQELPTDSRTLLIDSTAARSVA